MRRFLFITLLATATLSTTSALERSTAIAQDDWGVRRDPFDKSLIKRYKRILSKNPGDAGALGKLMSMYRRYRSVQLLVREYEKEQAKSPSFSRLVVLAYLHKHQGEPAKALELFEKAAAVNPKNVRVQLALGTLYRNAGNNGEARRSYDRALKLATNKGDKILSLRSLADLALAANDIDGAKKYFETYIKLDPKNVQTQLELGDALVAHKKFAEAIKVFTAAEQRLRSDPGMRVEVVSRIGGALEGLGEDDAAVKEYERGIKLVGRGYFLRKELTARIVEVFRRRQELQKLTKKFEKAWPAKRRDHFEWDTIARLHEETGSTDEAIAAYRKAVKKSPHELDTQRRLIVLLENSGLQKQALAQYEVVIRVAPGEPRFQLEVARRYWKRGDTQKAIAMAKKVETRFAGDAGVIGSLADLYSAWNKADKALAAYQRLTRIEPNDATHLENLGEQYFQRSDKKKAQQVWRKIIKVKSAQNYARLARIFSEHDLLQDGLEMFGRAIRLEPKSAELYKGRANVFERLRRWRDSMTDWEKVLALSPDKKSHQATRQEARRRVVGLLQRSGAAHLRDRMRDWTQRFAQEPADLGAGYYLVEAYHRGAQFDDAKKTLEKLLALRPGDITIMNDLVKAYRGLSEYDKAVNLLLKLAEIAPSRQRDFYTQIAEIKTELQQDGEAIDYVRRALEKSPNDPVAYQRLAERYQAMQRSEDAMHAYEKVVELAPRGFRVYFTLARLYVNHGTPGKAALLYREILTKASDQETLRKAGEEAVELEWLTGSLMELERTISPMLASHSHKPIYRRILVRVYARYVPQLVAQLDAKAPKTRAHARKELSRLGSHGLRPLLEALADEQDVSQQRTAVAVLGYLDNRSAAAPLVQLAKSKSKWPAARSVGSLIPTIDWEVRVNALVAAGRLGDPRTIPDLVELSHHSELAMREAAVFALGITGNRKALAPLMAAVFDSGRSVRTLACIGLANIDSPTVIPAAIKILEDPSRGDLPRAACAWLLGVKGDISAQDTLVQALAQGNDETQRLAAWALGELGDKTSLPDLMRAYFSKHEPVRSSIAQALGNLLGKRPAEVRGPLPYRTISGKFDATAAVHYLGRSTHTRPLKATLLVGHEAQVVEGLKAAIRRHRDLVVRALSELDSRSNGLALGALTDGVDGLDSKERQAVRRSIKTIGEGLIGEIQNLTQHRDPEVRRRSLSILAKLGGKQSVMLLMAGLADSNLTVRESAMQSAIVLARLHKGQAEELAKAISKRVKATNWQERVAAVTTIGRWPGAIEIAPVLYALRSDDKGFVRSAAADALRRRGSASPDIYKALERASDHRQEPLVSVRKMAVTALRAIPGPRSRELLDAVYRRDPSKRVRRATGDFK